MKMISFDIGIKNMAYCIFDLSNSNITSQTPFYIHDWKVANLMETAEDTVTKGLLCNCPSKKKLKKGESEKPCGRQAKYKSPDEQQTLCDKHAKIQTNWRVPDSRFSEKSLKTTNVEGLIKLWDEVIPNGNIRPKKRADMITFMTNYLKPLSLSPISLKKGKLASEIDLITIGKSIKEHFDKIDIPDISLVLIENQISPIANRMKTIQGMLAQYFIMRYESIDIRFISSSNKLKLFSKGQQQMELKEKPKESEEKTDGQKYKEHKKDAVLYCKEIFTKYKIDPKWLSSLETKKKDDLADCFLQGIWFLQKDMKK